MGIKVTRERSVFMWRLPEHLQQVVLNADRDTAAELAKAAIDTDLGEWQVMWDERVPSARTWLVARALAELATGG